MNRSDFQKLTRLRLDKAKVLLANGRYEGAYYLIGYAVECAFKACIAKQTKLYDFPTKNSNSVYVHNLTALLGFAGLQEKHSKRSKKSPAFELNWSIVKEWKEDARYSLKITKDKAEALYSAVVSRKDGIPPWLRRWW